ncbi:MAG: hypothetical protein PHU06_10615 [Gallionella sp.]|nr:hypothetical protein [Gallionella sp.]MDD4959537.1 hypothetical protein [Gallionella sp.]
MQIEILSIAMSDIEAGQQFYEQQQAGLGAYFLDTLFSDIDALLLYAGFISNFSAITVRCQNAFHMPFTIASVGN